MKNTYLKQRTKQKVLIFFCKYIYNTTYYKILTNKYFEISATDVYTGITGGGNGRQSGQPEKLSLQSVKQSR